MDDGTVVQALQGDGEAISVVLEHVRDDDDDVRRAVAASLGRLASEGDGSVLGSLVSLLEDDDEGVRAAAARAYGKVARPGDEAAIRRVLSLAREDDDEDVRRAAAGTLPRLRGRASNGEGAGSN